MLHRNSTSECRLKLRSTAFACSDWRPASRLCWIPPIKKARIPAYSRIFQPLPRGEGVSNVEFYTALCPVASYRVGKCRQKPHPSPQPIQSRHATIPTGYCRLLSPLAAYFLKITNIEIEMRLPRKISTLPKSFRHSAFQDSRSAPT